MTPDSANMGVLAPLGVSVAEETVYRGLLRRGFGSATDVAESTGLPVRRVRQALGSLERSGLLTRSGTDLNTYLAAPPETAVNILLLRRHEELEQARVAAKVLDADVGAEQLWSQTEFVERVPGNARSSVNVQILMAAKTEILGFCVPPVMSPSDNFTKMKLQLLRRGVKGRAIYTPEALKVPGGVEFIETLRPYGEEPRVAPRLLTHLAIVDRRVAYMHASADPATPAGEALIVHPCSLLDALLELFECSWERAEPFGGGTRRKDREPPLSEEEKRVLALLGAGLQNTSIAAQLGIADRTVQRHVGRIMKVLGTQTRFQTGAEAYRRGWLGMSRGSGENPHHMGEESTGTRDGQPDALPEQ